MAYQWPAPSDVITGLVPVSRSERHSAPQHRDGRVKPGHDGGELAMTAEGVSCPVEEDEATAKEGDPQAKMRVDPLPGLRPPGMARTR
jgi:hypothetical protein